MRSRGVQLTLLIVLGAIVVLLIQRPWNREEVASVSAPAPKSDPPPISQPQDTDIAPPTPASFNLPAMPKPLPEVKPAPQSTDPVLVPKDWLLRGSAPQNYVVKAVKDEVFSGQSSVLLASNVKNVASTEFASLMQSVVADPWLGQRVVFTVNWKKQGFAQETELWVRALDANKVVVAFNQIGQRYSTVEWHRSSIALDVPWNATEVAYGVNLRASGTLWVDGAAFGVLDRNIESEARNIPGVLGVVAQDVGPAKPLAQPSNMDFEAVTPVTASFRELPKDELGKNRF